MLTTLATPSFVQSGLTFVFCKIARMKAEPPASVSFRCSPAVYRIVTWVDYVAGVNFNLMPTTYFWADVERTSGGVLDEDWRATVGVRHVLKRRPPGNSSPVRPFSRAADGRAW